MKRLKVLGGPFSPVRFDTHFSRSTGIIGKSGARCEDISAMQTGWRRERDSNPRYRCLARITVLAILGFLVLSPILNELHSRPTL
jgi:hypothetical protein